MCEREKGCCWIEEATSERRMWQPCSNVSLRSNKHKVRTCFCRVLFITHKATRFLHRFGAVTERRELASQPFILFCDLLKKVFSCLIETAELKCVKPNCRAIFSLKFGYVCHFLYDISVFLL